MKEKRKNDKQRKKGMQEIRKDRKTNKEGKKKDVVNVVHIAVS